MASDSTPLPSAPRVDISPNIVLQPPLSRCGKGPGLIIIRPDNVAKYQDKNTSLDPEPLQKWAEESYAVVQITLDQPACFTPSAGFDTFKAAVEALTALEECTNKDKFGLLIYGEVSNFGPQFAQSLPSCIAKTPIAAIVYHSLWEEIPDLPVLTHAPGSHPPVTHRTQYSYPDVESSGFIIPGHPDFKYSTASVAHTRTLTFLKPILNGPYFDLEKIWEEHTYYEFVERSVEKTMATMVQEPYVNHIPTITGGIGRAKLTNFYLHHFIFKNPKDTNLELISRTVGIDRVVDEFIASLTHSEQIDWLLPGIPPTHKPLRIPCTSVVNIRGDRLYHEHISWDQATVLMQLDLLPEFLHFPYPLSGDRRPAPGKKFEVRTPAAGIHTADKLRDGKAVESNTMILDAEDGHCVREVDA
ncbi:carboxymethylenebutenolidase [Aspergillus sclerotioniger CBS 115572]|uniref:Carboxymethylenebutenolidase n=1 Tax=Aspergillus sclerotioniger CBS 115572 TaxID=1450535 RepID=A0A317X7X1_9EURO|nr:carboxymethylenebutenolidase [Aspergillus sclerotioniger CBS 115572]PWY94629.1 carboxymethylenebutenolidase [Aspergillus sclerotioniger CBS 115572]